MERYLQLAEVRQDMNNAIRQRAEDLERNGLKALDALHVACAEASDSQYLITCDKRLINRCSGLAIKVINPVDFVLELSSDDSD
jgi:predicted nucleic acid-binding protein